MCRSEYLFAVGRPGGRYPARRSVRSRNGQIAPARHPREVSVDVLVAGCGSAGYGVVCRAVQAWPDRGVCVVRRFSITIRTTSPSHSTGQRCLAAPRTAWLRSLHRRSAPRPPPRADPLAGRPWPPQPPHPMAGSSRPSPGRGTPPRPPLGSCAQRSAQPRARPPAQAASMARRQAAGCGLAISRR